MIFNNFGRWPVLKISNSGVFPRAVISLVLLILSVLCVPASAAATQHQQGNFLPSYLEQLEAYNSKTLEHYRLEKEQEKAKEEKSRRQAESIKLHTINKGETLGGIAAYYGVKLQELAHWNNIHNPHLIREGEVLHVLTIQGTLHHVEKGDTLSSVATRYNVDSKLIYEFNKLEENGSLTAGNKLVIPGATAHTVRTEQEATTLALASRGDIQVPVFRWPLQGIISSYYGMRNGGFHYGLDIAASYGNEVRAVAPGVVEFTGVQRGYGLTVMLDHGNGWSSLYAHNSRLLVKEGQQVGNGQPVALLGASGNATGPHLHLEIMYKNKKLNPLFYLP